MIFLSHSWKSKPAAYRVLEALLDAGVPAWIDEQQLSPGEPLRFALLDAISKTSVYLYLASEEANASTWVQDELKYALSREHEGKLRVVPVRLAESMTEMPAILSGRLYHDLDVRHGGVAKLAADLRQFPEATVLSQGCRISTTIRLERHQLAHTIDKARAFKSSDELSVVLLDEEYVALDNAYWQVSEVRFPVLSNDKPQQLEYAARVVSETHTQSKRLISEIVRLAKGFAAMSDSETSYYYYRAGFERSVRVLLHRLSWNVQYLRSLRDECHMDATFVAGRELAEPFDGHACDFVTSDAGKLESVGSALVPPHGHPFNGRNPPGAWGLTSPFGDLTELEVGQVIGDLVAKRFIAGTRGGADLPIPNVLRYGLA